jgi:hypothetical protein
MVRCAGPKILPGRLHQAGSHRVQLDVAHGGEEVVFIQQARVKAALKEVAAHTLGRIPLARIAAMGFAKGASQ